jgi:HlyD family secretion protein
MMTRGWRWRNIGFGLSAIGAIAAAWTLAARAHTFSRGPLVPAVAVARGEFLAFFRCRGELMAQRSVQIHAPKDVPDVQIVWLAPAGRIVKAGQPVIRLDPTEEEQQLKENAAALRQAQAALDDARAQANITAQQDALDLASAGYAVEKAKLEASKQAIVSAIQGQESQLDLAAAIEKQRVELAKVNLDRASADAKIASLDRQRQKAQADLDLVKKRLSLLTVTAPVNGIVGYLTNWSRNWMNATPFQAGDHVWPGAAIAEIPDLSSLVMNGEVDEADRGRVSIGAEVEVQLDALPELRLAGRVIAVSPLTEQKMGDEWPPPRLFRAFAKLSASDPRLRTGMKGSMDVITKRLPDAISVPAAALFSAGGKPVIYVREPNGYRPVTVQVLARNASDVAISGLPPGSRVAVQEPPPDQVLSAAGPGYGGGS